MVLADREVMRIPRFPGRYRALPSRARFTRAGTTYRYSTIDITSRDSSSASCRESAQVHRDAPLPRNHQDQSGHKKGTDFRRDLASGARIYEVAPGGLN